ncbi:MAG: hypothetical protein P8X96_00985 [Desulfobacteraceae bacterium]
MVLLRITRSCKVDRRKVYSAVWSSTLGELPMDREQAVLRYPFDSVKTTVFFPGADGKGVTEQTRCPLP